MTSQTKLFIEISDVLAIRLECKKCGASLIMSLAESVQLPRACINCNHDWWDDVDKSAQDGIRELLAAVKKIERAIEKQGVKFSLEIVPEQSAKP